MRIESLTFLRFCAAFSVVGFHFGEGTALSGWLHPLFSMGPQLVTFFFVLSGFVLMVAYSGRPKTSKRRFYWARVARILPIYWVALAATCALLPPNEGLGLGSTAEFLLHSAALHAWVPGTTLLFNYPAWSISVELFFYSLFPFVLSATQTRRRSSRAWLGYAAAFWLVSQLFLLAIRNQPGFEPNTPLHFESFSFLPIHHLGSFFLGCAGGYAFTQRGSEGSGHQIKRGMLGWAPSIGLLVLILALARTRWSLASAVGLHLPFEVGLVAPLYLALIWTIATSDSWLTRSLSLRPLAILGEASYSLYICQVPVHLAFERWLSPLLTSNKDMQFGAYVALLVVVSIASFYGIERPCQRLIRKYSEKLPAWLHPAQARLS